MSETCPLPLSWTLALSGSLHAGLIGIVTWISAPNLTPVTVPVEVRFLEGPRTAAPAPVVSAIKRPDLVKKEVAREPSPTELAPSVESVSAEVVPEAGASVSGMRQGHYDSYASEIIRELNRHKVYPETALRLRQQGRVKVRFRIDRTGQVLEAEILEKAPFETLNRAARRLIEDVRRFKPFPESVNEATWIFTVPIEYTM